MRPLASPRSLARIAVLALASAAAPATAGSLDRFRDVFSDSQYDGFRFGYGAFLGERHDDRRPPGHLDQWDRLEDPTRKAPAPEPPTEAQPHEWPEELEERAR